MEALWGRGGRGGGFKVCARSEGEKSRQYAHMCCHDNSVPSSLSHQVVGAGHLRTPVLSPLPLPTAPRSAECQSGSIPWPCPYRACPRPTLARPSPNPGGLRARVAPTPDPGHQPSLPRLALRRSHRSAERTGRPPSTRPPPLYARRLAGPRASCQRPRSESLGLGVGDPIFHSDWSLSTANPVLELKPPIGPCWGFGNLGLVQLCGTKPWLAVVNSQLAQGL